MRANSVQVLAARYRIPVQRGSLMSNPRDRQLCEESFEKPPNKCNNASSSASRASNGTGNAVTARDCDDGDLQSLCTIYGE